MPPLPVELIEKIIDIVAGCCPESLPNCALVSRQWVPRSTHHLYHLFRAPTITTVSAVHTVENIVRKHHHLALLATSLEVAPVPELNLPSATSFIPFHRLSSNVLPNVRHLVLGEKLRWGDYPLVYRKSLARFFDGVTTLDLSCDFGSVSALFRVIRSFRNLKGVRLVYPHQDPPRWMFNQTHLLGPPRQVIREMYKLQNLELSLAILKPVLDVCGDSVISLSVVCPQMSTVSVNVATKDKQPVILCSMTNLQTVDITVPVENDSPTNHTGLEKLCDLLLAPMGYQVENSGTDSFRQTIQRFARRNMLMKKCQECSMDLDMHGATTLYLRNLKHSWHDLSTKSSLYSSYASLGGCPSWHGGTSVYNLSSPLLQQTRRHSTGTTLHPLLAHTRLHRAPITYQVSFTPSARSVLNRKTHSTIPSHILSQPATDPPTPAGARLVLRSYKFPWPVVVSASYSSISPWPSWWRAPRLKGNDLGIIYGKDYISNLDMLYAVHNTLMVPITPEEWEALGHGSKAQQKVTQAYQRRCTRMGGGWEGGVRRVDWLGEKTWLIGVEVDKAAGHGGAFKLVFGRG